MVDPINILLFNLGLFMVKYMGYIVLTNATVGPSSSTRNHRYTYNLRVPLHIPLDVAV